MLIESSPPQGSSILSILTSLVMAGIQLELLAIPPFFSLGLMDFALLALPSILELLFNISLMASAWYSTGCVLPNLLNLTQALICSFTASSIFHPFFPISSFTASAHSPHISFPENLSRIWLMYSGVHSSHMSQHSHLAFSTSEMGGRLISLSMSSLLSSSEMSESVLCRPSTESLVGLFLGLSLLELEPNTISPFGAMRWISKKKDNPVD